MKKKIYTFNEQKYEVVENYKDAFDEEALKEKITDYFDDYDYIIGDWSYNKLRLKGFCDKKNSLYNKINDINSKDKYIKENCAYECRYFVIKKINE